MYAVGRNGEEAYYCIKCCVRLGLLLGMDWTDKPVSDSDEVYEWCEDCIRDRLEYMENYNGRRPKFNVGDLVHIKSKIDWIPECIRARKIARINRVLVSRSLRICYQLSTGDIKQEHMIETPIS